MSSSFQIDAITCQGRFLSPPVSLLRFPKEQTLTGDLFAGVSLGSAPRNDPYKGVWRTGWGGGSSWTTTPREALKMSWDFKNVLDWGKEGGRPSSFQMARSQIRYQSEEWRASPWLRTIPGREFSSQPLTANTPSSWRNECLCSEEGL